jgi:hypothetical protein
MKMNWLDLSSDVSPDSIPPVEIIPSLPPSNRFNITNWWPPARSSVELCRLCTVGSWQDGWIPAIWAARCWPNLLANGLEGAASLRKSEEFAERFQLQTGSRFWVYGAGSQDLGKQDYF